MPKDSRYRMPAKIKNPKIMNVYHKRYRIVYTTDTEARARRAVPMYQDRGWVAVDQLANGRWAVGVRKK